jgi:hypothetical protein
MGDLTMTTEIKNNGEFINWIESNLTFNNYADGWELPVASFSDYSGSQLERANSQSFRETFEFVTVSYGGHGTVWTIIDTETFELIKSGEAGIEAGLFEEFVECCEALADYPVIDEELLSELEMEAKDEALESWARDDFKTALEAELDIDELDIDEATLDAIFWEAKENANEYFVIETGGEAYIDVDRVVSGLTEGHKYILNAAKCPVELNQRKLWKSEGARPIS